jgi:hypothetical protein
MNPTDIGLIWKVAGVVFACGVIYGELKAIRKDLARLEQKVTVHNNYDRRIVRLETLFDEKEREKNNLACRSSEKRV